MAADDYEDDPVDRDIDAAMARTGGYGGGGDYSQQPTAMPAAFQSPMAMTMPPPSTAPLAAPPTAMPPPQAPQGYPQMGPGAGAMPQYPGMPPMPLPQRRPYQLQMPQSMADSLQNGPPSPPQAGVGGGPIDYHRIISDPVQMREMMGRLQPIQFGEPEPEAKKEEKGGILSPAFRGLLRNIEDLSQTKDAITGEPHKSDVPLAPYEKDMEVKDVADPWLMGQKLLFTLGRSATQMGGAGIGALIGSAAGPVGTVVGAMIGNGVMATVQALGPNLRAGMDMGQSMEDAWKIAYPKAIEEGLISAASQGVFQAGAKVINPYLKMWGLPQVEGVLKNLFFQATAQTGLVAGGTAAGNVVAGRPIGQGVAETIPGTVINTAVPAVGGALLARVLGRRPGAARIGEAVKEGPPPGGAPGPVGGLGGGEEGVPTQGELPLPVAPIRGPQGEIPGVEATQPGLPLTPPEARPLPTQGRLPIEVPPEGPAPELPAAATEVAGRVQPGAGIPAPDETLAMRGEGVTTAQQPRLPFEEAGTRRVSTEEDTAPGRRVEEPPEPELGRGPMGPRPMSPTPEGWTIEENHTGPGYVVKTADDVLSVGDTPRQAYEFAKARNVEGSGSAFGGYAPKSGELVGLGRETKPAAGPSIPVEPAAGEARTTPLGAPAEPAPPPLGGAAPRKAAGVAEPQAVGTKKAPSETKAEQPAPPAVLRKAPPEIPVTQTKGEQLRQTAAEKRAAARETPVTEQPEAAPPGPTVGAELRQQRQARILPAKPTGMAREARREAEGQPQIYEPPAGERATVRGVEPGKSITEEVPKGSNLEPKAEFYARKLVEGYEGMADRAEHVPEYNARRAFEEYGVNSAKGRDRKYNTLPDYIERTIKEVNSPAAKKRFTELARKVQEAKTAPERAGASKTANAEYNRASWIYGHLPDLERALKETRAYQKVYEAKRSTAEKATAKTEGIAADAELNELVERMKREAEPLMKGGVTAKSEAIPLRSRSADALDLGRRATDTRLNDPLWRLLEDSKARGVSRPSSDYLNAIINNKMTPVVMPQYRALAQAFRASKLRSDLPVYSSETVGKKYMDAEVGQRVLGEYRAGIVEGPRRLATVPELIQFNDRLLRDRADTHGLATVVLHETAHAQTHAYIDKLLNTLPQDMTPRERAHLQAFRVIHNEMSLMRNYYRTDPTARRLSPAEDHALSYALTDYHEMTAQIFSDPHVANMMAEHPSTPGLRRAMATIEPDLGPVRNLWDGFVKLIRSVFNVPANSESVLAHVMRPMTDIMQAAGEFRGDKTTTQIYGLAPRTIGGNIRARSQEIRDATVHNSIAMETPIKDKEERGYRYISTLFGDRSRPVENTVTKIGLMSQEMDAIVRYAKVNNLLPEIENVRTARERGQKIVFDEMHKWSEQVDTLAKQLRSGPDAPKLNDLINDVSYENVRLGTGDPIGANPHVNTDEGHTRLTALEKRFNDLDPRAQQTYKNLRNLFIKWRADMQDASLEDVLARTSDLSPAERGRWIEAARSEDGLVQLADAARNPDSLQRMLARSLLDNRVKGDYFPMRRFGQYVVSWGEPGTPGYGVKFFERTSQANVERDNLIKSGQERVSQVFLKDDGKKLQEGIGPNALNAIDTELQKRGIANADEVKSAIAEYMMRNISDRSWRAGTFRREGVLGASLEHHRALAKAFFAQAYGRGNLLSRADEFQAMRGVNAAVDKLRYDQTRTSREVQQAQLIANEVGARVSPFDGDRSPIVMGSAARGLTQFSFMNNLARVAHFSVQLIDAHSNAESLIGARHGFAATSASLLKNIAVLAGPALRTGGANAMKLLRGELHMADWDMSKVYENRLVAGGMKPEHATRLIGMLQDAGLIDHTQVRELQRMAGPDSFMSGAFGGSFTGNTLRNLVPNMMSLFAVGEHAVDSMNRTVIAKTALEHELGRNGGNVDQALYYAVEQARAAMPNYNPVNKPRVATTRGPLGELAQPIMQYKLYGLHQYGVLGNLVHEAVTRGGEERSEAVKALGAMLLTHAAASGASLAIFGSLPMMIGLGGYDLLTGSKRPHTNQELETSFRNAVYDWFGGGATGRTISELLARGIPTLWGVEHTSIKLSNAAEIPELKEFSIAGAATWLGQLATGASGESIGSAIEGISKAANGDFSKLMYSLPRVIHDPMQAYQALSQGIKTPRGDVILPKEQITGYDAFMKSLGYSPANWALARTARHAEVVSLEAQRDEKSNIMTKLLSADAADRGQAMDRMKAYNLSHPESPFTAAEIKGAFKAQAMAAAQPGLFGVHAPKRQAPALSQTGRFATQ